MRRFPVSEAKERALQKRMEESLCPPNRFFNRKVDNMSLLV